MAVFVLVHGAWHGSWCWKRVRSVLQAEGHDVFTPTLTGLAERSHLLAPGINLETHILDVVNLIRWEELSDIILCGHSYAGCVISGVADRLPERIRSLVYLDAFILDDGENLVRYAPLKEGRVVEGWKILPTSAETFNVNSGDRGWVNRQCTMQPVATFQQSLKLTGGIDQIGDVRYIFASGSAVGLPFHQFYEKARAKGWLTQILTCGHDVMLDKPNELADLLIEALNQSRRKIGTEGGNHEY